LNGLFYIGIAIAAVFILAALFAPFIATHDVAAAGPFAQVCQLVSGSRVGTDA
jgi:hypothetical protein